MQASKGSPSLASSTAQLTSERANSDRIAPSVAHKKNASPKAGGAKASDEKSTVKKLGLKPSTITGAAAIASAGVVLPLVAQAETTAPLTTSDTVTTQSSQPNRLPQSVALNQSKGVLPQIPQAGQAGFTATSNPANHPRTNQTATTVTSSNNDLIRRDADGNWTLAYAVQANQSTQAVVSQLASETSQATAARTCIGSDCKRLAYINRQLPAAQQALQQKQQQLAEFEKTHAQNSLPTYKKVLSDRIGEISKQKGELANDIAETRGYIGQLRVRLGTVNVDLDLPEALLANDATYQFTWADLQRSEERLLNEYSKVNIDATELNTVYAEYRDHQRKLEQAANNALSDYLLDENTVAPPIMYESPAALDVLQALVVATHQEMVQLLREKTISQLEVRLRDRQQILTRDITTHERLQRGLTAAQASVDQYIEEREQIIVNASAVQLSGQGTPEAAPITDETLEQASSLQARLPEGTIAKTLMGIVVAAGCIAVVARKRSRKTAVQQTIPNPQQARRTPAQQPSIPLFVGKHHSLGQSTAQSSTSRSSTSQSFKQAKDENLLGELMELVETNTPVVPTLTASDIDLSIEIMARELDIALNSPPAPAPDAEQQFASEVTHRSMDSVRLSLREIDLFAEKAIEWVLKDLNQGVTIAAEPEANLEAELEQVAAKEQTAAQTELPAPEMAFAGAPDYRRHKSGSKASTPQFATERFEQSRQRRTLLQRKSA